MKKILAILLLSSSLFANTYYDTGVSSLKKGEYEDAVKEFRKSKEKDVVKGLVTDAQVNVKLKEAEAAFAKEKINEALKYEKEKKLKKALNAIKDAKSLLQEDKRLEKMASDYETQISDLDAKVKDGRAMLDRKEYTDAYAFFKKLMPYDDTNSSISSGFDSAASGIIKSYKKEAEAAEKNANFEEAAKAYKDALSYKPDDKGLKKEIERIQNRIDARGLLQKANISKDKGSDEAAFAVLIDAYAKDKENKDIQAALKLIKNDIASKWADRAADLEAKGQVRDAFVLVDKALSADPDDKPIKERLKNMQKDLSLKLAEQYRQKSESLNAEPELAYLYMFTAVKLGLKDSKALKDDFAKLQKKVCYKLGLNFESVKGVTVPADDKVAETTKTMLEKEMDSFLKKRCIVFSEPSKTNDGNANVKILSYSFLEQKQNIPHKVKYVENYQKNSNYDYDKKLGDLKVKTSSITSTHPEYKLFADALFKHISARDELKFAEQDVKKYREKEYENKKQEAKKNNEKFSMDKDSIASPYDTRLKDIQEILKTSKSSVKESFKSIPESVQNEIKDKQKEVEKIAEELEDLPKFKLVPIEKWMEFSEVVTKITGKFEMEIIVKDNTMNKTLANVKRAASFADESRVSSALEFYTEAGKQELNREVKGKKLYTQPELKSMLVEKTLKEIADGLEDSNLKFHGDRFYYSFNASKDRFVKTKTGILTFVSDRNLSDSKSSISDINAFIKKEYGVDLKEEEVKISETSKL